jgi:hypothetical protein
VKTDLRVLEARITPIQDSETPAEHEPGRDKRQQIRRAGRLISGFLFLLAGFLLLYLVATAALHNARLTDGYGPFINGGYNGLASVLIFGSWPQVVAFSLAIGHCYHVGLSVLLASL